LNFKPIFYVNGILLLILSAAMLIPALIDLAHHSTDWKVFAGAQIITGFTGFALIFINRDKKFHMTLRETFLLTTLSWVFMAAFGGLPFYFSEIKLSFTDAFFEAMSGITTTGSTVITGLDNMPHGILLWRALLQWLGGIGFLVVALAILPLLQISGMQLFKTQSFDIEKIMPSASQMAVYICCIYAFLTLACAAFLYAAGMTPFEAVCHAMATLSTGGFSTSDGSIGHFNSPLIEVIVIYFMLLASLPFVLYLRMIRGDASAIFNDGQVRTFLGIIAFCIAGLTIYLMATARFAFFEALRHAAFKVVTLITTSGFATQDYSLWGPFAIGMAFLITFLGGCSGSTAGGIKIFRLQILWEMVKLQVRKLMAPHGVFQAHYNRKPVDISVLNAVGIFFFVYIASFAFIGVLLQLTGLDFITAFSGAATAVSNVGPGLGSMIGPAGNFASLPHPAIWVLSLGMLLGRLEFFTLLVLLAPGFWKR
jgi:trk system potassium uptake protein